MLDGEHERETKRAREDEHPTPGERILHCLGQLYRRWRSGLPYVLPPEMIDVAALARSLGVWADVEFVQVDEDDVRVEYLHFPSEVLVIDHQQEFPWQLLSAWEWGREQEHKEFWRYLH